jgi:hypothetical protein
MHPRSVWKNLAGNPKGEDRPIRKFKSVLEKYLYCFQGGLQASSKKKHP